MHEENDDELITPEWVEFIMSRISDGKSSKLKGNNVRVHGVEYKGFVTYPIKSIIFFTKSHLCNICKCG